MDDELKRMVEAILFAAARKLELAEIAKLCKHSEADVLAVLSEWKVELDSSNGPTMLVQDGSGWKLTVREKYAGVIKKVVSKTELPKGHLETLAIVAYKAPVLQSKVIKLRTNKAYDHLSQLEESGLIVREKSGRTKLIKLTPKFFEYFDIDPSKLRQKFASSGDVEKAIEKKELEIESAEVALRKEAGVRLESAEINLETYPVVEKVDELLPTGVELIEDKVGGLKVYDVPLDSIPVDERPKVPHQKKHKESEAVVVENVIVEKPVETIVPVEPKSSEEKIAEEVAVKVEKSKPASFKGKGLFPKGVPPEVEAKIEEKIKSLLEPKKEDE